MRSLDDLHAAIAFFEARHGRLHGFRFKDWTDFKSCAPGGVAGALDQRIGTGNGSAAVFALVTSTRLSNCPETMSSGRRRVLPSGLPSSKPLTV